MLFTLPLWVGCDGCRFPGQSGSQPPPPSQNPEESSEFNFGGTQALPLGNSAGQTGVKPGHWFTASETIRANRADHRGVLRQSVEIQLQPPASDALGVDIPPDGSSAAGEKLRVPLLSERPSTLR